jgi:hypothetical protein
MGTLNALHSLRAQQLPQTLIAIYGGEFWSHFYYFKNNIMFVATGVGKSSIINAILDGMSRF